MFHEFCSPHVYSNSTNKNKHIFLLASSRKDAHELFEGFEWGSWPGEIGSETADRVEITRERSIMVGEIPVPACAALKQIQIQYHPR